MFTALRERIALAAVRRTLPARMTADAVAAMPDGLHAAVAGSGSPLPDAKRGNSCVAVIAGARVFVVDAGERASETLNRMQIAPERIEAVLLTHFHSDHIGGLGSLALQRWVAGPARTPMRVIGPPGVDRVVAGYNEAYAMDSGYRTAHHGEAVAPTAGAGMTAETYAIADDSDSLVLLDQAGLTITAFTVDHAPVVPAVGYRFDYSGRSLVLSGDTTYSPVLVRVAKGADLLIHDALSRELLKLVEDAARKAGLTGRAKIFSDIPSYHASPQQAADAAREAGVHALALTHIIPPLPLNALEGPFLGDTRQRFAGPLWIAQDGDLYSLPAGGHGVARTRMLRRGPAA
jgi:ribonuclease Z